MLKKKKEIEEGERHICKTYQEAGPWGKDDQCSRKKINLVFRSSWIQIPALTSDKSVVILDNLFSIIDHELYVLYSGYDYNNLSGLLWRLEIGKKGIINAIFLFLFLVPLINHYFWDGGSFEGR